MAFSVKNRIRNKKDFDTVFRRGKAIKGSFLFIKVAQNSKPLSRFGIAIPVKAVKKAVIRNRIRRKLSELIRLNMERISGGYDIIIVINNGKADVEEIGGDLHNVFKKSGIIR